MGLVFIDFCIGCERKFNLLIKFFCCNREFCLRLVRNKVCNLVFLLESFIVFFIFYN